MRTNTRRRSLLVAVGAGAGIAAPFVFPSAALAHDRTIYSGVGQDRGGVTLNHTRIRACNTVVDGHYVTTYYRTIPDGAVNSVTDVEVDGLCTYRTTPVYEFKVCTADVACSDWYRA